VNTSLNLQGSMHGVELYAFFDSLPECNTGTRTGHTFVLPLNVAALFMYFCRVAEAATLSERGVTDSDQLQVAERIQPEWWGSTPLPPVVKAEFERQFASVYVLLEPRCIHIRECFIKYALSLEVGCASGWSRHAFIEVCLLICPTTCLAGLSSELPSGGTWLPLI